MSNSTTTEEIRRLEVPQTIEKLRKEGASLIAEADQLEKMLQAFPNLRRREGRWKKIVYYTKDVNTRATRFDMRHNCGCCSDSPLEVWPYFESPFGKIYSDPPDFKVGERDACYGGDIPYKGWEAKMRDAGIPEEVIGPVSRIFRDSADQILQSVEKIYGGEKDHAYPVPNQS